MTTKEAFEAWYDDEEITPLPDDYTLLGKRFIFTLINLSMLLVV